MHDTKLYAPLSVAQQIFDLLETTQLSFEEQHAALEITRSLHNASEHGITRLSVTTMATPNDAPNRCPNKHNTSEMDSPKLVVQSD